MKKITLLVSSFFMFAALASAQNVDEIIANYTKAAGGMDQWDKIKSIEMKAKINQMGMEFPATMLMKDPNMFKTEINVMDKNLVFAFDGKEGWNINPFQGSGKPEKMSEEESKKMADENNMKSDLMFYKKNEAKVELLGSEELEGTPVYKVKMTKKSGDEITYYIDKDSYLLVAERTKAKTGEAAGVEVDEFFSDYKQVGDVIMPHFIEQKANGQSIMKTTINEIKLNLEIDNKVFAFPTK
jgi:outer membrane lipoprotein-sorting protein